MQEDLVKKLRSHPAFSQLKSKRATFGWILTVLMFIAYYGYILLIAYDPKLLAQKLAAGGVTSIGIPLGLGVIVFTIVITWVYVSRANSEFDALTETLAKEANK
ncbi:MAG TPA: DUF485 domain-containing protein [Rhodocyclaceae bacterium]